MKLIQMKPSDWAKVQDNPIQRDTAQHAKKAERTHLKNASETQAVVAAAQLPNGTLVKLDGHTRCALWSEGKLPPPALVHVVVHQVRSMEEAIELYKHFDNPAAAENAFDRINGAYRLHGIVPRSRLLTGGGITTGLRIIDDKRTVYEMVGEWKDELLALDEVDVGHEAMPSPLVAAALLTIRKHGRKALDFWILYTSGGGTRIDGKSCGVDELTRLVSDLRARKKLATGGYNARQDQAGRAISCCDAWLAGRGFTFGAKVTNFKAYLEALAKKRPRAVEMA